MLDTLRHQLFIVLQASFMAPMVKNLPPIQETQVQSLSQEDPLEKEMVNPLQHSCLENPMDRGVWQATVLRVAKSHMTESCLENPMDGGAW